MDSEGHVILFDGVCNLCNGFVQFIIKRDSNAKFKFASLQSNAAKRLLGSVNISSEQFDSVVYISKGVVSQRSTAVLHIVRDMGGVWKLLYALIVLPRFIRDAVYDFVAANRYRLFGKRDECMIPTDEWRGRFLEV